MMARRGVPRCRSAAAGALAAACLLASGCGSDDLGVERAARVAQLQLAAEHHLVVEPLRCDRHGEFATGESVECEVAMSSGDRVKASLVSLGDGQIGVRLHGVLVRLTERQIAEGLGTGVRVRCPKSVTVAKADKFRCTVIADGRSDGVVQVEQIDDLGNGRWSVATRRMREKDER